MNMQEFSGPRSLGRNAELADGIQQLTRMNHKLERMLSKMGTRNDRQEFRSRLTREHGQAKQMVRTIIAQFKNNNSNSGNRVVEKLRKQFDVEFNKYNNITKRMESREREIMTVMGSPSGDNYNELGGNDNDDAFADGGGDTVQRRQSFAQEQHIDFKFLEYNEHDIAQRQEHIVQIESDAREVMEMYTDMQSLVNEQQESIDVIENNITSTRGRTEEAMKELLTAEEYQKRARKKQCCMVLIIAAVLTVIVVCYSAS